MFARAPIISLTYGKLLKQSNRYLRGSASFTLQGGSYGSCALKLQMWGPLLLRVGRYVTNNTSQWHYRKRACNNRGSMCNRQLSATCNGRRVTRAGWCEMNVDTAQVKHSGQVRLPLSLATLNSTCVKLGRIFPNVCSFLKMRTTCAHDLSK